MQQMPGRDAYLDGLLGTLSGCDLCRRAKENSLFPSILHKIVLKYRPLAPGAYSHPAKSDHLAGRFTAAATVISLRSKSLLKCLSLLRHGSPLDCKLLIDELCGMVSRHLATMAMRSHCSHPCPTGHDYKKRPCAQAVPRRSHSLTAAV